MPTNRLIHTTSPYLLAHADNPVDWYPWGPEAFAKAKAEQKPILLSVGYSTCHWCHVMAHESFEDQSIADVMNANFISIKVDREERPDIDHIYMTAVTAMTGQGGWPLTVFLTPDAKPFYGGTYFPPFAKWGAPGFADLLLSVAGAWRNDPAKIISSSDDITDLLRKRSHMSGNADDALTEHVFGAAVDQMSSQYDPQYGGFGQSPKFPMGHTLSFLLNRFGRDANPNVKKIIEHTLTAMARGGIYDHLGGGFHRYSTDQQWQVPHFEKMLYDQSLLAFAYAEIYQLTGSKEYAQALKETYSFVLREMTSPQGGFYCAQDADTDGKEGAFYVWAHQEIRDILGETDANIFNRYYNVQPSGNVGHDPHAEFTGQNVLFLKESIKPEDERAMEEARTKLFQARKKRTVPHLDDKVLTDWNGLMIGALAFGGCVLGETQYIDAARKAADFILSQLRSKDGLMHSWRGGQSSIEGMLEDYAFFAFGLIHLYEATFEEKYLKEAIVLVDRMNTLFGDPEHGGFFMTASNADALILRPMDMYDGALPSGNSVAGFVLMKLYYFTKDEKYKIKAEQLFKRFLVLVSQAPQAYTFFLHAYDLYLNPPIEITVNGKMDPNEQAAFRRLVFKNFIPAKVVQHAPSKDPWTVGICRAGVCQLPTTDMAAIEGALT